MPQRRGFWHTNKGFQMSDRPVERTERARDEGVYVSRTEEDKKQKEKFTHLADNSKQILFATFFSYLKKMFDTFSPSKQLVGKVIDEQEIIQNLQKLKQLLQKLSSKDLSSDIAFAIELSDTWCTLNNNFENIEILERKNLQEVANFRHMITTIKNYPPKADHCFGYYLHQHAGKDWLPFPFIQLLEGLHKDHQENSQKSILSSWIKLVDAVIDNFKRKWSFNP